MSLPRCIFEKLGAALVVERADLAVEHAARRLHGAADLLRDAGETGGEVVVATARQRRFASATVAVARYPSHFTSKSQPAPRNVLDERREHRDVRRGLRPRCRSLVALADEEPVLLLAVELGGHERPEALQPLAVEADCQAAVVLLLDELVRAPVPDLDRAGAVLPLGISPSKVA